MCISEMTIDDIDEALALWQGMKGVGLRAGDDNPEALARYLARNPGCSFVARLTSAGPASGVLVGTILAGHDGRRGFIYHAAVAADSRTRGIGRALAEQALEALRAQGIRKVGLVCIADNYGAKAFWEKLGFGEREDLRYMDTPLVL